MICFLVHISFQLRGECMLQRPPTSGGATWGPITNVQNSHESSDTNKTKRKKTRKELKDCSASKHFSCLTFRTRLSCIHTALLAVTREWIYGLWFYWTLVCHTTRKTHFFGIAREQSQENRAEKFQQVLITACRQLAWVLMNLEGIGHYFWRSIVCCVMR